MKAMNAMMAVMRATYPADFIGPDKTSTIFGRQVVVGSTQDGCVMKNIGVTQSPSHLRFFSRAATVLKPPLLTHFLNLEEFDLSL